MASVCITLARSSSIRVYAETEYVRICMHSSKIGYVLSRSGVTRGVGGRTALGDTLQGVTPEGKNLWANLQRIVDKRGRTGEKGAG